MRSVVAGASPVFTVLAGLTTGPLTAGLVATGVGLGARFPRFNVNNAAKIVTGLGGLLYMFCGLALLTSVLLLAIWPTLVLTTQGQLLTSGWGWLALLVTSVAVVALPLFAGAWALSLGARHLECHGIHA